MATAVPKALVENLVDRGAGDARHVRNMLVALADAAADAVAAGEDFTVPGIVKLQFDYAAPKAKGSRWKKGEEVAGFGGVVSVKDTDSPAVKEKFRLKPLLTGDVRRFKPGTKPEAQSAFAKSRAGKNVKKRKG